MSDTHQNSGAGGWDYSTITADTPAPSLHPFSYRLIEPIKRKPPFAPLIPRLFWLFGSAPPISKRRTSSETVTGWSFGEYAGYSISPPPLKRQQAGRTRGFYMRFSATYRLLS